MDSPRQFARNAVLFESALGLIALGLGALLGVDPLAPLHVADGWLPAFAAALGGVLAAVPMLLALVVLDRYPGPLGEFKDFVERHLVPLFRELTLLEIGLISLAAGFGEELLFRGLLQLGLAAWIGPPLGWVAALIVASIVFGCCHWLNSIYAVLGTLIGIYLGGLLILTDHLLVPIVAHAVYDFVAIVYMVRRPGRGTSEPVEPPDPPPADAKKKNESPTEIGPS